jgi:hypothetical protein
MNNAIKVLLQMQSGFLQLESTLFKLRRKLCDTFILPRYFKLVFNFFYSCLFFTKYLWFIKNSK